MIRDKEGKQKTLPFIYNVLELQRYFDLDSKTVKQIEDVSSVYPFKIPFFYLNLADRYNPACPIRKQCLPDIKELSSGGYKDPLVEEKHSRTPSFIKKYPNRGVFLVGAQCAMYCRFCNRKRFIGKENEIRGSWEETFRYINKDTGISEVIISGGDPMMLAPEDLDYLLSRIIKNNHIKLIRISSRVPVVYPEGISKEHLAVLKKIPLIWFVIHINHPKEITPQFSEVIKKLRASGCPLISQTVLLRGVNDCPRIIEKLFQSLVFMGIKPYYLFQLDEVMGTMHFKVRLKRGVEIMHGLRKNVSGLAIPQYVLDITGGIGKIPIDYNYIKKKEGQKLHIKGILGNRGYYMDNGSASHCLKCGLCSS